MTVADAATDTKYEIGPGVVYNLVHEKEGVWTIKLLRGVAFSSTGGTNSIQPNQMAAFGKVTNTSVPTGVGARQSYTIETKALADLNRIWLQGITWSTLLLPIRYRPDVTKNGVKYRSAFATDLSVGPFLGYKFKTGSSYGRFLQIGGFAGPGLIDFPNIDSSTTNTASAEQVLAFTYGWGVIYQFENNLQVGLVNGRDFLGGNRGNEWPFQKKSWWSFAIGYKFLSN